MNQNKTQLLLDIPEDVDIESSQEAQLIVQQHQILLTIPTTSKTPEVKPLWYLIPTFIGTLIFVIMNMNQSTIRLTGNNSIASYVITIGLLGGVLLFLGFFTLGKREKIVSNTSEIYWRNFPSILTAYTIILTISLLLVFQLLGQLFLGVRFDLFSASFIFASFIALISFIMIYVTVTLTPRHLIRALTIIAVGGVGIAMYTNSEQQWWLTNLSFLGSNFATSNWQFNFTLILASLIMIAMVDFLFEALYKVYPRSKQLIRLKVLLLLLALFLGGVGIFPYNTNATSRILHNFFAQGLVIWVILLIVGIKWLVPHVEKSFVKLSYGVGILLVIVFILFKYVRYLSLTAFEIISFILAFTWLIWLLQRLISLSNYGSRSFTVTLQRVNHEKED